MLNKSDTQAYLNRLGIQHKLSANSKNLKLLHTRHLHSIPFENLDIALNKKIHLVPKLLLSKLIDHKRGGFCYELNYAFCLLLNTLGFNAKLLAARVYDGNNYGKPFDHALILIGIGNRSYIADVGFGDCFLEPLDLHSRKTITQGQSKYKLETQGELWLLWQNKNELGWQPQYCFELQIHDISAFYEMCTYNQCSPESSFTQKSVCTLASKDGRITISNGRLITTKSGEKSTYIIQSESEYQALLLKHFNIRLAKNTNLSPLLSSP